MNFDDLDAQMRKYEQSLDQVLLPELYLVARLDGNRFTRLTKEVCKFEAPFDVRFRDMMIETVKALMNYGFRVIFGYTESDEIYHQTAGGAEVIRSYYFKREARPWLTAS